jgi:hypothetical protein
MAAGSNPGGFLAYKKLSKNEKQSSLRVFKSGVFGTLTGHGHLEIHISKKKAALPLRQKMVFFSVLREDLSLL